MDGFQRGDFKDFEESSENLVLQGGWRKRTGGGRAVVETIITTIIVLNKESIKTDGMDEYQRGE